jgi:glycosyltransferase involved in cell wall biosynthesis
MLEGLPNKEAFTPIFNFTDVDYFQPDSEVKREHLMFLGRIENIKGTKEAIQASIESNTKIIVAGNIQPGHEQYFNTEIKPLLSHPLVEYVGTVNDEQKRHYLRRAKALLFPIKWEEPFGIVLVEALACGTPVIGFKKGSVPEVIMHEKNGFIVDTTASMTSRISDISLLDHEEIRKDAVKRFSLTTISEQYLNLLLSLIRK